MSAVAPIAAPPIVLKPGIAQTFQITLGAVTYSVSLMIKASANGKGISLVTEAGEILTTNTGQPLIT